MILSYTLQVKFYQCHSDYTKKKQYFVLNNQKLLRLPWVVQPEKEMGTHPLNFYMSRFISVLNSQCVFLCLSETHFYFFFRPYIRILFYYIFFYVFNILSIQKWLPIFSIDLEILVALLITIVLSCLEKIEEYVITYFSDMFFITALHM